MADDEELEQYSTVEIYTMILLGILRYTPVKEIYGDDNTYQSELTKKLRFANLSDPNLLRACIDVIEDAECSISEVLQRGLSTKQGNIGEMYLRLYGVLNACYLQVGAVIDLLRLFNATGQKEMKDRLNSLNIIELRHKVASHTTSYIIPNTDDRKIDFYKLSRHSLSKWGEKLFIIGHAAKGTEINLIQFLHEFNAEIVLALDVIVEKELSSRIFQKEPRAWLESKYNYIKSRKNKPQPA